MELLALLKTLLQVSALISSSLAERRLLDAGEARAVSASLMAAMEKIDAAKNARLRARADALSGGLRNDDGFRRD
jgi:hypothetical protein